MNWSQWITPVLYVLGGAMMTLITLGRILFNLDKRLQRIENQDLNTMLGDLISKDWHDHRYPMLQNRVFDELDKIQDEQKTQGQNIAVLLERDRTGAAMERMTNTLVGMFSSLIPGTRRPQLPPGDGA